MQDTAVQNSMKIPALCFKAVLPADGLPMLGDWISTATSIWGLGYEGFRESVEFRPADGASAGSPMTFACLEAVKGIGRMSIVLFSFFYSYLSLKTTMNAEELEDMKRCPKIFRIAFGTSKFQKFQR